MARSRHNSPQNQGVFVVNGKAVTFYLWGTSQDDKPGWSLLPGQRIALRHRIEGEGGRVCDNRNVDTIIVKDAGVPDLEARYKLYTNRYVEPPAFVGACIANRRYAHKPVVQKSMSGRPPGISRVNFTPKDDMNLCKFLATAVPEPESGGRQSSILYATLMAHARDPDTPDFRWAIRHTEQSWRERYKTQRKRFDPIIDELVRKNPPPADGKGRFGYDRRMNNTRAFMRLQEQLRQEEEEEEGGQGEEEEEGEHGEPEEEEGYGEFTPGRDDEDAYEHSDDEPQQEAPRRNARRGTDPGPRGRDASPEEPRERARTHTGPPQHSHSPAYDFDYQPEEDYEDPSGAQRRPSQSPTAPEPPPQQLRKTVRPRPVPRASAPGVIQTTQVPMSSQVTLVGPVPTQLRAVPASQQQQQAQAGPGPRTLALRQGGVRAASRAHAVPANDDEEDEDEDEDGEGEDEDQQSHTIDQTNEEEQDVEGLLNPDGSYDHSASRLSPEAEEQLQASEEQVEIDDEEQPLEGSPSMDEQLDSDDERTRQKLLDSQARPSSQARTSRKRPAVEDDDEDEDVEFAQSLDFDNPAPRRSSVLPSPRRSLAPSTPAPGRVTVSRHSSGYASSESAVPLPHTRASAEKKRRLVEEPYEPPPGTRAAALSARKPQPQVPRPPSPQRRKLRSRPVAQAQRR